MNYEKNNENIAKLTELLVLSGARPVSSLHEQGGKDGLVRDLEFYYITKPVAGQKRKAYVWTMNPEQLDVPVNFQLQVSKLDEAFDLPFYDYENIDLNKREQEISKRILNSYENDVYNYKSVLENTMPKAENENWITDVYGELKQEVEEKFDASNAKTDSGLTFRKFDYDRNSLREVLIGKVIEAERVKAEGFVLGSNSKDFADLAHKYILERVAEIERQAYAEISVQKGED